MPLEGQVLFKSHEEIIAEFEAALRAAISDVYWGEDGVLRMVFEIAAGGDESVFLAVQLVSEDMFVPTANPAALDRHGDQYGVPRQAGTGSSGTLVFSGTGGTVIGIGAEVAYDPENGDDPLYFLTTAGGTIPNPGTPAAPTATLNATGGNLTGLMEYVITFTTTAGETLPGAESIAVLTAAQRIDLSAIPLGGAGTIGRRIYRSKDGGPYLFVAAIANNSTTVFADNVADGSLGGNPPSISTAERVSVAAESDASGEQYNVLTDAITVLTDVPDGVISVTNPAPFTGATDPQGTEDYRIDVLAKLRSPQTGSPTDIKVWAEENPGVGNATVFLNDNLGTPTPGHTTVRISAADGSVAGAPVIAEVLADLQARGLPNITFHVAAFTATATAVTVSTTLASGYVLADVSPAVTAAITSYINSLQVGETLRIAGLYDAIFGLPGVIDVVVSTPASNQATGATSKRTPGTITVT